MSQTSGKQEMDYDKFTSELQIVLLQTLRSYQHTTKKLTSIRETLKSTFALRKILDL